jgi:hypothetical protein
MWKTVEASIRQSPDQWKFQSKYWLINETAGFALWVANRDYGLRGWTTTDFSSLIHQHGAMKEPPAKWRKAIWALVKPLVDEQESLEELARYLPALEGFERAADLQISEEPIPTMTRSANITSPLDRQ